MTERGVVIKDKGKFAQIRIGRNSACGSCGKCGMTDNQKHADFYVENTLNAKVNDVVEIEIPEANSAKLAFVAYIIPLIPALALLFLSVGLKWAEWLSILLFFVGLAVGFVIIALIDRYRKYKWASSPTMKSIVTVDKPTQNTIVEGENKNEQN